VFVPTTYDTVDGSSSGGVSDGGTSSGGASSGGDAASSGASSGGTSSGGDASSSSGGPDADCPSCCKTAADCDDKDTCTNDSCNVATGKCVNAKMSGCGELSAPCSKAAPCNKGVCHPVANACVACVSSKDCGAGKLCQGNKCATAKGCKSDVDCKSLGKVCNKSEGVCVDCGADADCPEQSACLDHKCTPAPPCTSSKQCQKVCNTKLGKCVECAGGEDCAAGQYCTTWGKCAPGICKKDACAGKALFKCRADGSGYEPRPNCNDDNVCTDDGCDNDQGCTTAANAASCNDGDTCTSNDKCSAKKCVGGKTKCDDNNPCTDDKCEASTGCYHTANNAPCNDDNKCTTGDACSGGACSGKSKTSADCTDNNDCTDDYCDPKKGCAHKFNEKPCDDGSKCTDSDKCLSGKCTGQSTKCDDGDKCTTDGCDASGGCTHTPNTASCDDGNFCTVDDACNQGKCAGGKARDCNDDKKCTKDICNEESNKCVYTHASNWTYCNDGNACTYSDRCSSGVCKGKPTTCDDKKPCTTDSCDTKTGCKHLPNDKATCTDNNKCTLKDYCKSGWCKAGPDKLKCDDNNSCTADSCNSYKGCVYTDNSASKCNDLDPCTTDKCDAKTGKCSHEKITGCCKAHNQCDDKDATTTDKCAGNKCWFYSEGCKSAADCDDGDGCTEDLCTSGKCENKAVASCSKLVEYGFEKDLEGWTADKATSKKVQWTKKDATGMPKGKGAAVFGLNSAETFTGLQCPNYGYLTSPEIKLAKGQAWSLDLDLKFDFSYGYSSYNRLYVYIEPVSTKQKVSLGTLYMYSSAKKWHKKSYDVTAWAGTPFVVKLYARIGNSSCSSSSYKANGKGIYLDHLAFTSTGKKKTCSTDGNCYASGGCNVGFCKGGFCGYSTTCCKSNSDCDDGRACTTDTCKWGKCRFTVPGGGKCCSSNKDCGDGVTCTLDLCKSGKCENHKLAQCCEKDADCDDKDDKCTIDSCNKTTGKCEYKKTCCASDKECDDKDDKCTTDKCDANTSKCTYTPTGASGCCLPQLWHNSFDDNNAKGMTFSNKYGNAKGWQIWNPSDHFKSAKGALYYGDPVKKNYDFGTSYGSARIVGINLPNKSGLSLKFWLYMVKEASSKYDKLYVQLKSEKGNTVTLWSTSTSDKSKTWYDKNISLDSYKGQKVEILFYFTTIDPTSNSGLGVIIDDVQVLQKCS